MSSLHAGLADVLVLYALFCAGWGLLLALRGRAPTSSLMAACAILTLGLTIQGALGLALLAKGEHAAQPGVHVMYGALGVLALPLAVPAMRRASPRVGSIIVAAAALFAAVLIVRASVTGS